MKVEFAHLLAVGIYGAVVATIVRDAVDALGDWRAARAARRQWGQRDLRLASHPPLAITFEPNRLRYRRIEMPITYADVRGDTPWVAPTKVEPLSVGRGQMKELEQRYPDLTRKLRDAAIQAEASIGGPITSADVWAILDSETAAQAKGIAQGRIMSAAFDTSDWEQTGRFLKKGSRGRPISEWRRKTRVAA